MKKAGVFIALLIILTGSSLSDSLDVPAGDGDVAGYFATEYPGTRIELLEDGRQRYIETSEVHPSDANTSSKGSLEIALSKYNVDQKIVDRMDQHIIGSQVGRGAGQTSAIKDPSDPSPGFSFRESAIMLFLGTGMLVLAGYGRRKL
jgi:hypothetical protein